MSSNQQIRQCFNCGQSNATESTFCSRCGTTLQKDTDPFIGRHIGRYILNQRIGAGGSGTVYKAGHADLGKQFAVKILLAELIADEESKARFQREMRVLADINHENVVSITDAGYEKGIGPYMVMEWLDGTTLFAERKQRGVLAFEEILTIFDQLTDALSFMHQRNIVHRDLKPENMMLVSRSNQRGPVGPVASLEHKLLKIFDFGIALLQEENERKLTAAGMVVGTPHYMAPEQIIVDAPVDFRADLYAIGAILFELLAGQPPFWGVKRPIEVMECHLRKAPPSLQEVATQREFPAELQAVVSKALAKSPRERFQDARSLFNALEQALSPAVMSRGSAQTPQPQSRAVPQGLGGGFGQAIQASHVFKPERAEPVSPTPPSAPPLASGLPQGFQINTGGLPEGATVPSPVFPEFGTVTHQEGESSDGPTVGSFSSDVLTESTVASISSPTDRHHAGNDIHEVVEKTQMISRPANLEDFLRSDPSLEERLHGGVSQTQQASSGSSASPPLSMQNQDGAMADVMDALSLEGDYERTMVTSSGGFPAAGLVTAVESDIPSALASMPTMLEAGEQRATLPQPIPALGEVSSPQKTALHKTKPPATVASTNTSLTKLLIVLIGTGLVLIVVLGLVLFFRNS